MMSFSDLVLAVLMVPGQADDVSAKDRLKGLEPLIGSWVYDGVLQEDAPGLGKKGDSFKLTASHRWVLGKSAFQLDWKTDVGGKEANRGRALVAWDPASKTIMEWAVSTSGNHSGQWTHKDNVWTYALCGIGSAGTMKENIVYSDIGSDSFMFQVTNRVVGGKELDDSAKYEFKRVADEHPLRRKKAGVEK